MLKPPPHSERCTYENAIGHRCRNLKMSADCALCPQHFRAQEKQRLRQEAIVHRTAQAADRLAPAAAFANVLPHAAEKFTADARDAIPGSVISINQMIERVLHLLVGNQMSARTATAAAALFRLLLKAQPQVDAETAAVNEQLYEHYLETGQWQTPSSVRAAAPHAPVTRASSPCPANSLQTTLEKPTPSPTQLVDALAATATSEATAITSAATSEATAASAAD